MKHGNPLVRLFLSTAAALMAASSQRNIALVAAGPSRLRRKGWGVVSGKKWGPPPSGLYAGVSNGAREVARRQRQIARGIIHVSCLLQPPAPAGLLVGISGTTRGTQAVLGGN